MFKALYCEMLKLANCAMTLLDKTYSVSIVIPIYNEEKRIRNTISRILEYFQKKSITYELIIVDDGSTDGSLSAIKEICSGKDINLHFLHNIKNMGKGYSVKRGAMFSRGDIVLFTDADLSVSIEEYDKLEKSILEENYDIAFGSRGLKESRKIVAQSFVRDRLGKLFGVFVRALILQDVMDSQCGFKAFTKEAAQVIFYWQTIYRFGFDPELLYIAKCNNFRYKEIPVSWKNDFDSKLNLLTSPFIMGLELLKIKIKSMLGHYSI